METKNEKINNFGKIPNLKKIKTIENYIMLETLGKGKDYNLIKKILKKKKKIKKKGSFSKVKRGKNIKTNQNVAIKIINLNQANSKKKKIQVTREINALKVLQNHPHIVKIIEVLKTKKKLYIVMELLTGGELYDRIVNSGKNHRFNEKEALRYFQQIVFTLKFCHSKNVMHRDLKPENILLDEK
jgi:serine/threonine protein kinase